MFLNTLASSISLTLLWSWSWVLPGAVATTVLNFRRDHYLDQKLYPEGTWAPIPEEGGRLQFVSHSEKNLTLSYPLEVDFGGFGMVIDPSLYPDHVPTNGLDWCHAQYNSLSGSVFTSLHAHDDELIASISKVKVTDASGVVLVNDAVQVGSLESPSVQVTYFTTRNKFQEMVLHVHNYGKDESTIDKISINTDFVVLSDSFTLKSGEHTVITHDVSKLQLKEVDVWTVSLSVTSPTSSFTTGYGGRLNKELFPIEDWPKSSQCPFPVEGASSENFDILKNELHINTHFMGGRCDAGSDDVFKAVGESNGSWFVLPSEGYSLNEEGAIPDSAYDGVAAVFVGDESDSSIEGSWDVWNRVLTAQRNTHNKYAIYDGGHSNHLNGVYSGVSDIQGMDFYVASCAPHITLWTSDMRLQGSYDYLFNTRQNHKPLTTWLYSQGWCEDCWNVKDMEVGELVVQLGSVLASGGKGLMLFQSDISLRGSDSWVQGGLFLSSVALLGERLRVSDVEGASFSTSADESTDVIMQPLASPDSLLFVVINTRAGGYNDKTCLLTNRHWIFEDQIVESAAVQLPTYLMKEAETAGVSVSDYFEMTEVSEGSYVSKPKDVDMSIGEDGIWNINDIHLGTEASVVRIFSLAPKM